MEWITNESSMNHILFVLQNSNSEIKNNGLFLRIQNKIRILFPYSVTHTNRWFQRYPWASNGQVWYKVCLFAICNDNNSHTHPANDNSLEDILGILGKITFFGFAQIRVKFLKYASRNRLVSFAGVFVNYFHYYS